jgi:hypothetical protein
MLWDKRGLSGSWVKTNFKFCDSILQYTGASRGIVISPSLLRVGSGTTVNEFLLAVSCTRFLYYTRHRIEARRKCYLD